LKSLDPALGLAVPLRLMVLSDLHVDHPQNRARIPALVEAISSHSIDVLVLAGDISHKLADVEWVLGRFGELPCRRLFVAGNHDIWIVREGREDVHNSWDKLERLGAVARAAGFVFLEDENAVAGDLTFVGSMGWYDYTYANPGLGLSPADYTKKKFGDMTYMDRDYARWGMTDTDVVARLLAGLQRRLDAAADPVVHVSHHVPKAELVLRRGNATWDFFNAYMGSTRTEGLLAQRGVTRFVFGHTHRPVALVDQRGFVLNNPLGYPRQALTPNLVPYLVP
jgi:putative phosphoesterase